MLDRWSKAATIALAVVLIVSAIVAPTIGGVVWLARMNYDVKGLRSGMDELQADVQQLQTECNSCRRTCVRFRKANKPYWIFWRGWRMTWQTTPTALTGGRSSTRAAWIVWMKRTAGEVAFGSHATPQDGKPPGSRRAAEV